ncbi:MAG: hydroxymethylbilane synthase [Acidobacteriota bacterium]|nr:MAG: hydroxymethylbilane synthase [Acidobacteriota bacterium]
MVESITRDLHKPQLIIGSRGSRLALWQANWVKSRLEEAHPGLTVSIEIIKTTGDKLTEASLVRIGGKGVFTKEIEEALLDRRVDLAVHSLKDLPTTLPAGLGIAAITERVDVRDALIVSAALGGNVSSIRDLPQGARVGTSSLRRAAQLRHRRPDLRILELRGNVETRLRKLDDGQYDAIILASAGLIRLGYADRITAGLDPAEMLTAVGQGALGIESRTGDEATNRLLGILDHPPSRRAAEAERAVLRQLGGGCAVPIAAHARIRGETSSELEIEALVANVEGNRIIRKRIEGSSEMAEVLGERLARELVEAGARDLLPRIGVETRSSLTGCRIIVTRAAKQAGELVTGLEALGAEVVHFPTIEIREPLDWSPLDRALSNLSSYDWLAFTSANAVEFFLKRLDDEGHGRAELISHKVCAVGSRTAGRLALEKISVHLTPERFTAEALVEEFIRKFGIGQRLRGSRMLLPASNIARDGLRPALAGIGVEVDVVEAYRTVMPETSTDEAVAMLSAPPADYIVFTSPSTISNLATILETEDLSRLLEQTAVACIGPVTAETASEYGLSVKIMPEEHTSRGIIEAILRDRQ